MVMAAVEEAKVLLHGLWTAITGSPEAVRLLSSSTPDMSRDLQVSLIFAVVFFIYNMGARFFIIEPLSLWRLGIKDKMKQKFGQSTMEMIFYGSFSILGAIVVPGQEWFWPSSLWWKGFADGGHEVMRADLRCYYLLYVGRYVQNGISCLLEHKRKDFLEMQIHHWTTVVLIYISYFYGWNRVGCCVMLLLDPADPFLHIAKMFKYTSDSMPKEMPRKALWQGCADVFFAIFAVVFFCDEVGHVSLHLLVCAHRSNQVLCQGHPRMDMRCPPRDPTCTADLLVLSPSPCSCEDVQFGWHRGCAFR